MVISDIVEDRIFNLKLMGERGKEVDINYFYDFINFVWANPVMKPVLEQGYELEILPKREILILKVLQLYQDTKL